MTGDIKQIQLFIQTHIDNINIRNNDGKTLLHYLCCNYFSKENYATVLISDSFNKAKLLIKAGADVNAICKKGRTPLHIACYCNKIEIVELLLNNNADINIKDNNNNTPLDSAKRMENIKIIKLLEDYIQKEKEKQQLENNYIPGLGDDTPTYTNATGGKQSYLPYDFTQIKPIVLFSLANILHKGGKKYGKDNWLDIPIEEHLNHALCHIYKYIHEKENSIEIKENDLEHAFCRLMMACYHDLNKRSLQLETFEKELIGKI